MPHLLISAAHKSSGKTTLTTGLCAALAGRGFNIQPFKKGPDYIDPLWLSAAAGRSCINLDFHTQASDEIRACFANNMQGADLGMIEGNKGLFDGVELDGRNSNAALARLLGAPVVLVIDTQGMTRGVAPLLRGYLEFEDGLDFAGVILNKVAGSRHEGKLRAVVEHYTDLEVLGAVGRRSEMQVSERHLGLVPSNEQTGAKEHIAAMARAVSESVNLDRLAAIAANAPPVGKALAPPKSITSDIRIGFPRDAAFNFYYPDDLEALERAGVQLVAFDALNDANLPDVDGLFLGGGFPETNMKALEKNASLRGQIRAAIENNMPVYAECGGLMYLARKLVWRGEEAQMAGVLPGDAVMYDTPRGRGYVVLRETSSHPWPEIDGVKSTDEIPAHEFHYSQLENYTGEKNFAYDVLRGAGVDGVHDGIVYKNLLASYAHMRGTGNNNWPARFAAFVRACKEMKS